MISTIIFPLFFFVILVFIFSFQQFIVKLKNGVAIVYYHYEFPCYSLLSEVYRMSFFVCWEFLCTFFLLFLLPWPLTLEPQLTVFNQVVTHILKVLSDYRYIPDFTFQMTAILRPPHKTLDYIFSVRLYLIPQVQGLVVNSYPFTSLWNEWIESCMPQFLITYIYIPVISILYL